MTERIFQTDSRGETRIVGEPVPPPMPPDGRSFPLLPPHPARGEASGFLAALLVVILVAYGVSYLLSGSNEFRRMIGGIGGLVLLLWFISSGIGSKFSTFLGGLLQLSFVRLPDLVKRRPRLRVLIRAALIACGTALIAMAITGPAYRLATSTMGRGQGPRGGEERPNLAHLPTLGLISGVAEERPDGEVRIGEFSFRLPEGARIQSSLAWDAGARYWPAERAASSDAGPDPTLDLRTAWSVDIRLHDLPLISLYRIPPVRSPSWPDHETAEWIQKAKPAYQEFREVGKPESGTFDDFVYCRRKWSGKEMTSESPRTVPRQGFVAVAKSRLSNFAVHCRGDDADSLEKCWPAAREILRSMRRRDVDPRRPVRP